MSAKVHANILNIIPVIAVFAFFPRICQLPMPNMTDLGSMCFGHIIIFGLIWVVALYRIPVKCSEPGCGGKMDRVWGERIDYSKVNLKYVCRNCRQSYDAVVILPPANED